jgi:hypothetical protein
MMFSGPGFPSPTQGENRGVQQLSFWTVGISLRAAAQKLQWPHSFPGGFRGPEGFPQKHSISSLAFLGCTASCLFPVLQSGAVQLNVHPSTIQRDGNPVSMKSFRWAPGAAGLRQHPVLGGGPYTPRITRSFHVSLSFLFSTVSFSVQFTQNSLCSNVTCSNKLGFPFLLEV